MEKTNFRLGNRYSKSHNLLMFKKPYPVSPRQHKLTLLLAGRSRKC